MAPFPQLGETRQVGVPGGTISYHERGEGRPLVFVHGVFANAGLWRDVVPLLADRFRCIAPDWPMGSHEIPMDRNADLSPRGHARIVAAFCDELGLTDPVLVGNDSGGAVCQILISERPDVPGRLVLTNCDSHENFFPLLFKYLKALAFVPGATFLAAQAQRLSVVRRSPIAFGKLAKRMPDDLAEAFVRPLLGSAAIRRDAGKFLRGVHKRDTLAAAEHFPHFDKPVLIAWGEDDKIVFPMKYAERLAREFPNATLVRIPDSYTFVPVDQPVRLAEVLTESLADELA
jgi:pimeloyl-ACP methyl ester carboxylesterase